LKKQSQSLLKTLYFPSQTSTRAKAGLNPKLNAKGA
jgi:hypothetical protein